MKPISKSKNKGLHKLAQKKPELAKKFGYNPNRIVAKKGGKVKKTKRKSCLLYTSPSPRD